MAKFYVLMMSIFGLIASPLIAGEPDKKVEEEQKEEKVDISKVSEAFGHLIGKNIGSIGFDLDLAKVIKGIQDEASGKDSPLSEMECIQAISNVQEDVFKKQATENLTKAEEFLAKNEKGKEVISLEDGKLQYKIEKSGEGTVVEEHFSPLIRYVGKFLDGKVFGSSKEDEMISLDETIPGFSKGLIGMKEGEKRTLFIHPELGYGTNGYLPPNSLLTFEVELVKANATKATDPDALSSNTHIKGKAAEVASPDKGKEVIR